MTKFTRTANGRYSVAGHTYESLIGTRAQVWHGTSYKTSGGLTRTHLMKNKSGRIVSRSKHLTAKKDKRLVKAGFLTKKGHFGFIKKGSMKGKSRKMRGGNGVNYALSPSKISGITKTSGVEVQIVAGQGN